MFAVTVVAGRGSQIAGAGAFSLVLEDDVQSVDDTGNVTQATVAQNVSTGCLVMFASGWGETYVKTMLMSRSAPQPRSRKTPRGGSRTAKMILMMSL